MLKNYNYLQIIKIINFIEKLILLSFVVNKFAESTFFYEFKFLPVKVLYTLLEQTLFDYSSRKQLKISIGHW